VAKLANVGCLGPLKAWLHEKNSEKKQSWLDESVARKGASDGQESSMIDAG